MPAAASAAAAAATCPRAKSARVYAQRCAVCHGPDGRGNGPAAPSLIPRPRDFTLGLFKYKSTPAGQPPTDDDLRQVIANGLPASAMPYFHDLLSDSEIDAVVAQIKQFSKAFSGVSPQAIVVPPRPAPTAASTERGRALYISRDCAGCHGPDGRKARFLVDASTNHPTPIRDLSAPWTFHGGSDPNQIWLRLTTGIERVGHPPSQATLPGGSSSSSADASVCTGTKVFSHRPDSQTPVNDTRLSSRICLSGLGTARPSGAISLSCDGTSELR